MTRRLPGWRALVVCCLLVTACGDDGRTDAPPETPPVTGQEPGPDPADGGDDPEPPVTAPSGDPPAVPPDAEAAEPACPDAPLPDDALDQVGWADVDGDGRAELWVRTGAGASAVLVGLLRWDAACAPEWVELDGVRAELPVGGSVANAAGVVCDTEDDPSGHVTVYSASSADGEEYEVAARELRLDGTELVEVAASSRTVAVDDARFGRYTGFACGAVVL